MAEANDKGIAALVERLRSRHADSYPQPGGSSIFTQAADELEALQRVVGALLARAGKVEAALAAIAALPAVDGETEKYRTHQGLRLNEQARAIAIRALAGDK